MSSFQSTTIANIIDDLNYSYLLPSIQRELVWDSEQMLDLFDSIVREYPIGSFLFWKVSGEYAQDRVKYKFASNYIEEPIYPEEITDVSYHSKRYLDEYNSPPNKVNLVLDGQQRLSTIYIGLKGTYTERGYNQKRDRIDSWTRKQLYLNVLSSPSEIKKGRKYEFKFKKPGQEVTKEEYWYRVGDILQVTDSTEEANEIVDELEKIEGITVDELKLARKNVQRNVNNLYMATNKREIIPYFTESEEDQEKALDIFIRTNEGGTQLSKSDVLLSIATARWQEEEEKIVAREEIKKFVDKLNQHEARGGITFDSNFVLRSLLLCSDVSSLSFTLENFGKGTLDSMKKTWIDQSYKRAIINTLDLIHSYGFTTGNVQSKTVLLPIVYFYYKNNNPSLSWDSAYGQENRPKILYWIASMVITGEMNTAGTVQTVQAIRNAIREDNSNQFPLKSIEEVLKKYNKSMGFDREQLERWTLDENISNRKLRVALSLVYFPEVASEQYEYEMDHIFPKSKLDKNNLIKEYNIDPDEAEWMEEKRDCIANLQLIRKEENRSKHSKEYGKWIESRSKEYRNKHKIPDDKEKYKIENFRYFIEERSESIVSELLSSTPNRPKIIVE